jgi:putative endonuclease
VKTRRSTAFGAPVEAVTTAKQRRLRVLATRWLSEHPDTRRDDVRFDVASVLLLPGRTAEVEIVESAF